MGFRMTQDQLDLRDTVRDWAQTRVLPVVAEYDEKNECIFQENTILRHRLKFNNKI